MLERVRQNWNSVSREAKGTVLGIAAAAATLGVTFGAALGVSALLNAQGAGTARVPTSTAQAAAHLPTDTSSGALSAQLVRGQTLFTLECASCHGANAQGGFGPDLRQLEMPEAQAAATIQNGIKPGMPAFGRKYSPPDVQALTVYVKSLHK